MIFCCALLLYCLTLCPTVYVGDSGELIAAAHTLGIAHPTGYPLYLLFAKLFAMVVPIGSVAFRVNLLSAVAAALAAQWVGQILRQFTSQRWWPMVGAMMFACLGPIWTQATVARVYPLSACFSAALILLMVRWWRDPDPKWWWRHNLCLGFGLANHTMVIAHLPAALLLVLCHRPRALKNIRGLLLAGCALLPGLGVYGYLPWRAATAPALDYRVPVDSELGREYQAVDQLATLKSYLLREMHQTRAWTEDLDDVLSIVQRHCQWVWDEVGMIGLAAAILGLLALWRRRQWVWIAYGLVVAGVNWALLVWHGAWWDIFLYPRYLTCAWVLLGLLIGSGWLVVGDLCQRWAVPRWGAALVMLAAVGFSLVPNFWRCDRSSHTLARDYAEALFAELPNNAQVFSMADSALYPMLYLQLVEGVREDVELVNPLHFATTADLAEAFHPERAGKFRDHSPRALYTTDPGPIVTGYFRQFIGQPLTLPRLQAGLLDKNVRPQRSELVLPEWQEPEFAFGEWDRLDEFSRSLVAQIWTNIAEAQFARGDRDGAYDRLQQVASWETGRPWGYFAGIELCLRMGDVELGRRLLRQARTFSDPKATVLDEFESTLERLDNGLRLLRQAQSAEQQDSEQVLTDLAKAARQCGPYLPAHLAYAEALLSRGLKSQAIAALTDAMKRFPRDVPLFELRLDFATR